MATRSNRKTGPHDAGLNAADLAKLTTWMPEIAASALGPIEPEGSGFRIGGSRALSLHADGSFHDFRDDRNGFGPLDLIRHLHGLDSDVAVLQARQWLSSHVGEGRLSGVGDDVDEAAAEDDIFRQAQIETWWSSAQPIAGTPAEVYLGGRAIKPNADDFEQLRWQSETDRGDEGAMLAAIRDDEGGLVGLQRTFITPSGQKSAVIPVRQTHRGPHNWNSRGAVRFGALTGKSVFVCEGVEDALSVRASGHGPAIAILGVARLGRIVLPDAVEKVIFVRDDDPVGSPSRAAMARGLVQVLASGRPVLLTPLPSAVAGESAPPLKDINDLLQHEPEKVHELLTTVAAPLFERFPDLVEAVLEATSLLPALGYERARGTVQRMLGFRRVQALDDDRKARIAARTQHAEEAGDGCDPNDIPWPDPVSDLGTLMDAAVVEITRYIVAPPEVIHTAVLWSVFAHILHHALLGVDFAPRLAIQAASTQCGKSRMAECVACLVPRDRMGGSISTSAIFRVVDALRPSLIVDEADNFFRTERGKETLGILNSGHSRRSAYVERVERDDDDGQFHVVRFSTFTAMCFTSIDWLPETLQNRCVVIVLRRKMGGEEREHLPKGESAVLFEIRRMLIRWAQDITELPEVTLDPRLANRRGDNWRWLLRIAAEAGGEWPARALAAAFYADDEAVAADQNRITALLAAIWEVLATKGIDRIETQALIDALLEADDGRWQEAHRGKPITEYFLREILKMVIPHTEEMRKARQWKDGGKNKRGYTEGHFEDAWQRYLGLQKPSAVAAAASKKASHKPGCDLPGTSGTSSAFAGNPQKTRVSPVPDNLANSGTAPLSGTTHGTAKTAQNLGSDEFVPEVPDVPNRSHPLPGEVIPRGARRRRGPNGLGKGGQP